MSADNKLDKNTVHKIAKLARLELSEADTERYQKDLSEILALAEQMQECDTEEVKVMTHPMDAILRLREDIVTEKNSRDEFQKVAPNTEKGLYLVPKVLD